MSTQQTGFTLIEILVTMALAATLMALAVPSFAIFLQNSRLSDAVGNFMSATSTARANSMKFGLHTYLVPNDVSVGWSSGWYVFTDKNWDKAYTAGTDDLVLSHEAIASDVTIIVNGTTGGSNSLFDKYLLFNGSGFPQLKAGGFANGTLEMQIATRTIRIIFDQTGRVRSCNIKSTGC